MANPKCPATDELGNIADSCGFGFRTGTSASCKRQRDIRGAGRDDVAVEHAIGRDDGDGNHGDNDDDDDDDDRGVGTLFQP